MRENIDKRLPAPQKSDELPEQGIEQSERETLVDVVLLSVIPAQHSDPYSIPAQEYAAASDRHRFGVILLREASLVVKARPLEGSLMQLYQVKFAFPGKIPAGRADAATGEVEDIVGVEDVDVDIDVDVDVGVDVDVAIGVIDDLTVPIEIRELDEEDGLETVDDEAPVLLVN